MKCANIIERGDDADMINESVVVLGGGGVWGVAWMTGTIMGLAEYGIDLTQARAFIGTSAGSIVGSQVAHGYSPTQLFTRQTDRPNSRANIHSRIAVWRN
jgi:predicted acylesterase/phospholipase RssA